MRSSSGVLYRADSNEGEIVLTKYTATIACVRYRSHAQ